MASGGTYTGPPTRSPDDGECNLRRGATATWSSAATGDSRAFDAL